MLFAMHALAGIAFALAAVPQEETAESLPPWSVRLEAGKRVEYVLKSERTEEVERNDRFVTTIKYEQPLALELVSANEDGTSTVACHFGHAKGTVKSNGSLMPFDSESGVDKARTYHAEHSGLPMLRAQKSVRVVIDARGAVQKVEGLAAIYKGSEVEKDLVGKDETLEDSFFVEEAQNWFALLPDVEPPRGAHWTDSFPMRSLAGTRVEFRPQCVVKSISDAEITWSFKTAAMGSPGSKSKALPRESKNGVTTIELKARAGREWLSEFPFVHAAAIGGTTSVSRADGLARKRLLEWEAEVDASAILPPGPKTTFRERVRVELVRR